MQAERGGAVETIVSSVRSLGYADGYSRKETEVLSVTPSATARPLPRSLLHLSRSFIAIGALSIAGLVADYFRNESIHFDFSLPLLLMGIGIRQLSWTWRTLTLAYCWLVVALLVYFCFEIWDPSVTFEMTFGGERSELSKAWAPVLVSVMMLYVFWVYRVLTKADVRARFVERQNQMRTVRSW